MPRKMTEQEREAFLADRHVAVISIVSEGDRPPLTIPVFYHYEPDGDVTFFSETHLRKSRLLQGAGKLSINVQQEQPPGYVTVEGTLVATDQPPSEAQLLAIVRRYLPEDQAQGMVAGLLATRSSELVLFTIRPDRWLSQDFSE